MTTGGKKIIRGRRPDQCLVFVAVASVIVLVAGCATEEKIKKSDGYYQEGVANLNTDRQRAFVSFQKAVQLNPSNQEAHYGLGHIYASQGKLNQAEEEFREAIRLNQDYSEAHTYLGQVLAQQDRWTEAIKSFQQALTNPLYSTPDLARFHLGRALAHEGDMKGATAAFEDALLVNPPSVPPAMLHLELGRAYYKLGYDARAKESLAKVSSLDQGGEYAMAANQLLERLKR
ncbi:MAG: tetratricopeptide repeat protein [Nitrospiraceae bacterium]